MANDPPQHGESLKFDWDSETVEMINAAIRVPSEIYELTDRLKSSLPQEIEDHVKAFVRALDYHAQHERASGASADEVYIPRATSAVGYAYPEPLSRVQAETITAWQDAVALFSPLNDVVSARLNDLLWCLKAKPRPDLRAREAQTAFRRLWKVEAVGVVHRADGLVRALELALELRDSALVAETVSELVSASEEVLSSEEWAPGVALTMINALAGLKQGVPVGLRLLISSALERYSPDPFIIESLQRLRMQLAEDPRERRAIALETVAIWKRVAEDEGGLVGMSHLEHALELARSEGLDEAGREIRIQLQQPRTPEELGMKPIATELSIPEEAIEELISQLVDGPSPEASLARMALYSPISDLEADGEQVREQMRQAPLQHLFSRVVTNADGLPVAHIRTDEQKFEYALIQNHTIAVILWGGVLREVFDRLDHVSENDVREFVKGDLIDDGTALGIAKAYTHYRDGDFEACLHYLIVRIERTLRRMVRELGLPIYREPSMDGRTMGAYKGLGDLLNMLDGRAPGNQLRYLSVLLTERTGLNLRNRSAHGLMQMVSAEEALLGLHVALILATWSLGPPDSDPRG